MTQERVADQIDSNTLLSQRLSGLMDDSVMNDLVADFPASAARRIHDQSFPRAIRGLLWNGWHYHDRGNAMLRDMSSANERAELGIDETPVTITAPETAQGVLVGIVGAKRDDKGRAYLEAIAAVWEKDEQKLMAVSVFSDGKVTLHPDHLSADSQQSVTQIYPSRANRG